MLWAENASNIKQEVVNTKQEDQGQEAIPAYFLKTLRN